jgi:hypothetical protein
MNTSGNARCAGLGAAVTRVRDLILVGVIIAVTPAAIGCGGSASNPHAAVSPSSVKTSAPSSPGIVNGVPAESPPAGYRWAGSAAQGVWFAVPSDWAAINLAKINTAQALRRFRPRGMSSSTLQAMVAGLRQRHAFFVADLASAVQSSHQFATNGNAFCVPTPLAPGTSSSALESAIQAEYAQVHWRVLTIMNTTIDGDPGVRSMFTILSGTGMVLTDTQYTVLAKNGHLCTVTLSTDNPTGFRQTFNKIGGTIRVS